MAGYERKIFQNEFMGRGLLVFTFILTAVPTRASTRSMVIYTAVPINVVGLKRTQQDRKAVWVFLSSRLSGP